jgi:hypothetical protein
MTFAQIGPLTAAFEALATAVGAGVLLGSFAVGTFGLVAKWPRKELGARALTDGYVGGGVGVLVSLLDLVLRYGF